LQLKDLHERRTISKYALCKPFPLRKNITSKYLYASFVEEFKPVRTQRWIKKRLISLSRYKKKKRFFTPDAEFAALRHKLYSLLNMLRMQTNINHATAGYLPGDQEGLRSIKTNSADRKEVTRNNLHAKYHKLRHSFLGCFINITCL
jgi:hypothetical protein